MSKFYQMELAGTKELIKQLKKLGPDAMQIAAGSLYRSGNRIMTKSQEVYVPVDTGALRGSGAVQTPEVTKDSVSVTLSYGNASVSYAIYVHEMNKAYRNGKQWRYLSTPLNEGLPDVERNLKRDLDSLGKR